MSHDLTGQCDDQAYQTNTFLGEGAETQLCGLSRFFKCYLDSISHQNHHLDFTGILNSLADIKKKDTIVKLSGKDFKQRSNILHHTAFQLS